MRIPAIKKLLMEDFQDQQSWISKLLYPLNMFMTTVSNGLSNGLTIQDNMIAQVKTILVNGATPVTSFSWHYSTKPIGCLPVAASKSDGTAAANPSIQWVYSAGLINIQISGLDPTKSYYITFYVIGG